MLHSDACAFSKDAGVDLKRKLHCDKIVTGLSLTSDSFIHLIAYRTPHPAALI